MTDERAPAEPYTTSFEATVERIDDREVVLDRTYFYAESGGQPADRGTLGDRQVVDVTHRNDEVVHVLADPPAFEAGETVAGKVDEQFRTYCMRAHTASHALYGAGRRLLEDLGYGGFDIGEGKIRVDFTTPTEIDDDVLLELERLTNRVVWESRPVTWETYPKEEALEMDRIAFNTKTEEGVGGDTVRVVTIGGEGDTVEDDAEPWDSAERNSAGPTAEPWDVAACGGTHVDNTREIGPVTVLERSNPGEGLTRVEFAVGPSAIRRRTGEKAAAYEAAAAIGTNLDDLPGEVERLQDEVGRLEAEVADLQERLAGARVEELREETVERDGGTWLVGSLGGLGPNDLQEQAKELAGEDADVVALVGEDGRTFVATAAADGFDAAAVVEEVTDEFGGGGGGSPEAAQGGGIGADPGDVVAFLR